MACPRPGALPKSHAHISGTLPTSRDARSAIISAANVTYIQGSGLSVTIDGYANSQLRAGTPLRDGTAPTGRPKEAEN